MYRVVWIFTIMHLCSVINIRDKKYLKDFGKNLRKIRIKANLSQEALGLDAGLGKNQVGMIERGEVNVTISTIKRLARQLEIQPKDLLDF
jgi:transcriptional regulator with XRE-family HTH domain